MSNPALSEVYARAFLRSLRPQDLALVEEIFRDGKTQFPANKPRALVSTVLRLNAVWKKTTGRPPIFVQSECHIWLTQAERALRTPALPTFRTYADAD